MAEATSMKVAVSVHGKVQTLDDEVVINTRGRTPLSKAELKSLGPQGVGLQVRLGSDVGTLKQNYVKVCHSVTHSSTSLLTSLFTYSGIYSLTSSSAKGQ
jgi:hypothetical protein